MEVSRCVCCGCVLWCIFGASPICRRADVRSSYCRMARASSDATVAAGGGAMSSNQLFESWDGQPAAAPRAAAADAAPGAQAIVAAAKAAKGGAADVINIHASSAAESSGIDGYNVTVTSHFANSKEALPRLPAGPNLTCGGVNAFTYCADFTTLAWHLRTMCSVRQPSWRGR